MGQTTEELVGISPQARVAAFVADYASAWSRWHQATTEQGTFAPEADQAVGRSWQAERDQLLRAHFVSPDAPELLLVDLDRPDHSPVWEQIVTTDSDGQQARVSTVQDVDAESINYLYQLTRTFAGWRINSLQESDSSPVVPVLDAAEVGALVSEVSLTAPLADPREALPDLVTDIPDFVALFTPPRMQCARWVS